MDRHLITVDEFLAAGNVESEERDAPRLISVDELRAAGALDVPAAWRKSLAPESRYTLPGFGDDDELDSQAEAEFAEANDELERTDQAHEAASSPARHSKTNARRSSVSN